MMTDWNEWSREAQRLMQRRNDEWEARYGLSTEPYRWDLDAELLTFQRERGTVAADLALVGTLSHKDHSFLWAWANEGIGSVARRVEAVRQFGVENDLPLLTKCLLPADHAQALELATVAGRVLDAHGLFVDKCDGISMYFLLFNFRLQDSVETVNGSA